jgi:hypothetical protein
MLINADHRGWIVATVVTTALATVAYRAYVAASPYGPSGGSWPGIFFGIAGTAAMVGAALLAARKRVRTWRLGSARVWMQAHIWLGVLAVPLILFHAGFGLGGALTTLLMVLFAVVTLSGLVGLGLQQLVPAAMRAQVPLETVTGQIDHVAEGLAVDAYEIVAGVTGPLPQAAEEQAWIQREEDGQKARPGNWKYVPRGRPAEQPAPEAELLKTVYLAEIRPYLRRARRPAGLPPDLRGLGLRAPDEWRPCIDKLAALCEESRQLGVQERLHAWLHNWLFVHAPLSFILLLLAAFHVYFALSY